ncbi:MAG: HD domain-containing phosphohydrolase [Spirochaetota bacterium]
MSGFPETVTVASTAAKPLQPVREPMSTYVQANAAFFVALIGIAHPPLARHSRQVGELVRSFARFLRMTENLQEELFTVALFHDLGLLKMDAAVHSTVAMTERHYCLDESDHGHAEAGASLIGLLPGISRNSRWIRHHHERYDGSGYPDGLHANSIPLGARIIAIADVYDQRCFERGESTEEAIGFLFTESGRSLDPQLVESFAIFSACGSTLIRV